MTELLVGVREKIARAEENIKHLNTEINAIIHANPPPYTMVGQPKKNGLEYVCTVFGDPAVPPRIPVLIGEIAHNLRSSLDHLVWALVIANHQTPCRRNQFPICTTLKEFESSLERRLIKGVSSTAKDIIRSLQPYKRRVPDDDVLHGIQELNNHDKHRLLIVTTTVASVGEAIGLGADEDMTVVGMTPPFAKEVSKNGVEFFRVEFSKPPKNLKTDVNFSVQIAFPKIGKAKLAPVVQTLSGLARATTKTIDMFVGEFR